MDKLISRADDHAVSYDEPDAYRTSNQIDRPMNRITRRLYASRGLHGHQATSERRLRAICLLENFPPLLLEAITHESIKVLPTGSMKKPTMLTGYTTCKFPLLHWDLTTKHRIR